MTDCTTNYYQLAQKIKTWGHELGFQHVGISDIDLSDSIPEFLAWLDKGYHGDMQFMAEHGSKRYKPAELLPGTASIVSVRMDYLPPEAKFAKTLGDASQAYVSRYALGRDYHKVIRNKLKKLGQKIAQELNLPDMSFRPFVDSAPVLERPIAEKAGLGWVGKHSLVLSEKAGSWFFLGELFLPLPLPADSKVEEKCGKCVACINTCPTGAIVEPYLVDSNKCLSYLTIEQKGAIPIEFRQAMGNRIYGCDDCQLICPWNRFADLTQEADFHPRQHLHRVSLLELWHWSEAEFLDKTQGSPIRRIGYPAWMRNIAVALGNSEFSLVTTEALKQKRGVINDMVDVHIDWALAQQMEKSQSHKVAPRALNRLIKAINVGLPRDA